jgi:hypothetical protein
MACPYFYPVEARAQGGENALLPLGDSWAGVCRAVPGRPWQPDEAVLRPLCNLGYARGNCARFPAHDGPDAVRFAVSRDDGATLRIYYVVERDHLPLAHGPLEYSRAAEGFAAIPADANLTRQASAYVESYLRRKSEAFGR